MSRVLVVGGGAAGLLAAIAAAENGHAVTILEKNEKLGKKLFITGKGRCNVTNACDQKEFFENIVSNDKFLYSAFYAFDNVAIMEFLEQNGCPLKTERGNRVFPVSDHSSDVIKALQTKCKKENIQIVLQAEVHSVMEKDGEVTGVALSNGKKIFADAVIVATGGISYPLTGSTGDGYRMAAKLGHAVPKTVPALVPFTIEETFCKDLQGLSLKNVGITISDNKKIVYSDFGEMIFTHYGVSGPMIISASSFYSKRTFDKKLPLCIDLKPALSEEQLDKRVLRDFEENSNKQFKNAVSGLFPSKMIPVMLRLSGIDPDKKVHEIAKEERKQFVHLIKNWNMTILGTRDYNEAIITQGGISTKEINPSTMESKLIKNLYFAGEVIDLDALTGGFNLQIAWSTGYLAGKSIG